MKRGQDPIGDWECFLDMRSWEAHFDDPLFIRYLNFLASLPGEADYQKTEAGSCSFYDRRKLMADGTVLLSSTAFSNDVPILERNFNTADVSFIGYPSADASFFTFSAFVILNASENPDASWQLIRTMFEIDEMTGWYGTLPGKSVLKTTFEENMDELRNDRILYRFEGGEYYAQEKSNAAPRPVLWLWNNRNRGSALRP